MAIYLPQDIQSARPYFKRKLRKIICAPLETLTDDYMREHGWQVEAIFAPVPGLALDAPAKENSLIVVIQKERRHHG